ncbi:hypothetical protein [Janibacter terrae]|uniref:hypothetical protein n=1 Tax=Janibacter terrae TaxID=103817 RepID=UPI0031F8E05E
MRLLRTLATTASVGALGLALAPTASAAAPADSVAYLADRLADGGDRLTVESGGQTFDDLGLTIDGVLGMSAAGSGGDASAAATDYVVANAGTYYGYGDEVYSAATAKLLTFASARGLDPRSLGGVDLVAQLQSLEDADGRFSDQSQWGDYSNTLGQAFGVIGLTRAGATPSTASVETLLSQQCDDGGFSLEFADGCVSDPDATSLTVQALDVVGGQEAVVQEAADYLESRQGSDGGVGGGATTEGANSNSTGLAAVAFRLAGRDDARASALGYVDALTFDCATPALAGGIAYNRADFDAAVAKGASAAPDGTITRSTAQALLGLTDQSYATVTSAGQAAATPDTGCDTPAPGGDDTDGSGDDGTDGTGTDGTGTDDTDTDTDGSDGSDGTGTGTDTGAAPQQPEIPAVVQTDGVTAPSAGWPAWALGLGAAATAAGATLVTRRRVGERVR